MDNTYFAKQFAWGNFAIGKLTDKAFNNGDEKYYEGISIDKDDEHLALFRTTDEDFIDPDNEVEMNNVKPKTKEDLEKAREIYNDTLQKVKAYVTVEDENCICFENYNIMDCAHEIRDIILDGYNKIQDIIEKS